MTVCLIVGGMFGGHYTAYAKCEDLLLPDANNHNANPQEGLEVLLQEYLTYLPGGLGRSSSSSGGQQGQQQGQQQRWFKFDDEFVLELPSQGYANGLPIDATIVSGKPLTIFSVLSVCADLSAYCCYRVGVFVVLSQALAIRGEHATVSIRE